MIREAIRNPDRVFFIAYDGTNGQEIFDWLESYVGTGNVGYTLSALETALSPGKLAVVVLGNGTRPVSQSASGWQLLSAADFIRDFTPTAGGHVAERPSLVPF